MLKYFSCYTLLITPPRRFPRSPANKVLTLVHTCQIVIAFLTKGGDICRAWPAVTPSKSRSCTTPVMDICSSSSTMMSLIKCVALNTSSIVWTFGSWPPTRMITTLQPFGSWPGRGRKVLGKYAWHSCTHVYFRGGSCLLLTVTYEATPTWTTREAFVTPPGWENYIPWDSPPNEWVMNRSYLYPISYTPSWFEKIMNDRLFPMNLKHPGRYQAFKICELGFLQGRIAS